MKNENGKITVGMLFGIIVLLLIIIVCLVAYKANVNEIDENIANSSEQNSSKIVENIEKPEVNSNYNPINIKNGIYSAQNQLDGVDIEIKDNEIIYRTSIISKYGTYTINENKLYANYTKQEEADGEKNDITSINEEVIYDISGDTLVSYDHGNEIIFSK